MLVLDQRKGRPNKMAAPNPALALQLHRAGSVSHIVRPPSHAMKSIEFLNTHATYKKERRLHNRNYLCLSCGVLRRVPAHYVPDGPPPPQHCNSPMVCLSHEQTVAATHFPAARRVDCASPMTRRSAPR